MIIQVCHWWRLLVCPCPVVFFILQPNHCPRDQPLTSNGAFTRGSVIFAALLTTCLDAFGEMPAMMMGRPILRKQTNFAMYRPGAIAVANTAADLPFSALRILVFNLIVYLMSHLVRDAGAFFVSLVFCFPYRSSLTPPSSLSTSSTMSLSWPCRAFSEPWDCSSAISTSRSDRLPSSFPTLLNIVGTSYPWTR